MSWAPPQVQWVVKVSKHCNLRCAYCYEYPFLGDRTRMSDDQIARMFGHIADRFAGTGRRMDFVWHGGEPLLLKPAFYRRIEEIQAETLGAKEVPYTNSVQTNLTILNEDVLDLFRGFFRNVGVSVDLFGGQRVTVAGRPVQDRVLENMQRLVDEGIPFGCITVLSAVTAPHVEAIFRFFEDVRTSFRLLPIYRTGYPGQQDDLGLSDREIVAAMKKVVDLWLASDAMIEVRPVQDYVAHVVRRLDGGEGQDRYYDKLSAEVVYIVDTDGSLYSNADAYDQSLCHGNLFEQTLEEIAGSDRYLRAVAAAGERMGATCGSCRFHGSCSGYWMGEATPEQRWEDEDGRLYCGVARPIQEYIELQLRRAGLVDSKRELLLENSLLEGARQALQGEYAG